jgi:dimethylargininase
MTTIALTRAVSPSIVDCALSFIEREPIDPGLAQEQHEGYEDLLRRLGLEVVRVPPTPDLPDAVFVEDTALVVDELAILTAPKLDSRRRELASMAEVLSRYRPLRRLDGDATLDGGDVLQVGRTIYVGLSARTNPEAILQLQRHLDPFGYAVKPISFDGCLHLKSAVTHIGRDTLLANPAWVDTSQFDGVAAVPVSPEEPHAGNALLVGNTVILPASFPKTRARLQEHGFQIETVDVSELQKAEAGVTCCSVIFTREAPQT